MWLTCGYRDSTGTRIDGIRSRSVDVVQIALALLITLVSACLLNLGYLLEHSVASKVPPLSLRRPVQSVRSLLGNPRWRLGFAAEVVGWLLYVVALALAPLSLVQAVA